MALPVYSLGDFTFKTLQALAGGPGGAPELPQKMLDIVQRPGVQGTGFVDLDSKGIPFQARSFVDVANEANAQTLISNYYAAVGGDKLTLIWRDNNYYTSHSVMFEVLRFEAPRLRIMNCITGGLNVSAGGTGVIVEGIWTLCPDVVE